MDRYDRQVKLREIGSSGQARIMCARVALGLEGTAADVAARYLAGAGVAGVRVRAAALAQGAQAIAPGIHVEVDGALPDDVGASAFDLRDPACRDICTGAHAALRALRAAVEVDA